MISSVTGTAVTGVTAVPMGIDTLYTDSGLPNTPLFMKKYEKQTPIHSPTQVRGLG